MAELVYEPSSKGAASDTLAAPVEDCDVTRARGVTIVRSTLPDRAALQGLIARIGALGSELLDRHAVTGPGGAGAAAPAPEAKD